FSRPVLLRIGTIFEPVERIPEIISDQRITLAPGEGLDDLAQPAFAVVAHRLVAHPLIDKDILYSPLVAGGHVGITYVRRGWNIYAELSGRSALVILHRLQAIERIVVIDV